MVARARQLRGTRSTSRLVKRRNSGESPSVSSRINGAERSARVTGQQTARKSHRIGNNMVMISPQENSDLRGCSSMDGRSSVRVSKNSAWHHVSRPDHQPQIRYADAATETDAPGLSLRHSDVGSRPRRRAAVFRCSGWLVLHGTGIRRSADVLGRFCPVELESIQAAVLGGGKDCLVFILKGRVPVVEIRKR